MAHQMYYDIEAISAAVQQRCRKDGPVAEIWDEIGKMRTTMTEVGTQLSERKGAEKAQARNLTLIVSIATAVQVATAIVGLLWKVKHGG